MFEFAIGAVLVIYDDFRLKSFLIGTVIFLISISLIVGSAVVFSDSSKMPGLYSLIPCVSAAALILLKNRYYFNRLLTNILFNYIGKISYSVYLIHWPVFVYFKYLRSTYFDDFFFKFLLLFSSICLGAILYYSVEQFFRMSKVKFCGINLYPFYVITTLVFTIFLISMIKVNKGLVKGEDDIVILSYEEIAEIRKGYWTNSNSANDILTGSDEDNVIYG